jgi:hypothetical protein
LRGSPTNAKAFNFSYKEFQTRNDNKIVNLQNLTVQVLNRQRVKIINLRAYSVKLLHLTKTVQLGHLKIKSSSVAANNKLRILTAMNRSCSHDELIHLVEMTPSNKLKRVVESLG